MAKGLRHDRFEQGCIEHQYRPGDGGHAAVHDDEELAAAHAGQPGSDHQWPFDHADEGIGRSRHADCAADAKRAIEQPGEGLDHPGQDAPVKQHRR